MSTQAKRMRLEKKANAKTDANLAEKLERAKAKAARAESPVTAEDLIRERDTKGLSWKQVAVNLDLGSPGHARTLYTKLTGKAHNESALGKRAPRLPKGVVRGTARKTHSVQWDDDTDQDEIIEKLDGSVVVVNRSVRGMAMPEERVVVGRIVGFRFDGKDQDGPLVVTVIDKETSAARSFRVADITEVV